MLSNPKILFLDIETAPNLAWVWGKYQQDVIDFEDEWYILSAAWKWMGEERIHWAGLIDYQGYRENPYDDYYLVHDLWRLFDEADIIIAHNGDSFDIKKVNARFLVHDMNPPSTYKTMDTLKIARKHFKFNSNRLDDLGRVLGIGRKLPNTGFKLWQGCMDGNVQSWKEMRKYNIHDVELLEQIYFRLRPYASNHIDLNMYRNDDGHACPSCQSTRIQKRGFAYARTQVRQRWHCSSCGNWFQGKIVKRNSTLE